MCTQVDMRVYIRVMFSFGHQQGKSQMDCFALTSPTIAKAMKYRKRVEL